MFARRAALSLLVSTALVAATAQAAQPIHSLPVLAVDPLAADARVIAASTGLPLALVTHELKIQDAVGHLQADVMRRWPDTYGGLWIDDRTGLVSIAFTHDAVANVASLNRSFVEPSLLRPVTVARSYRTLQGIEARMRADRDLVASGRLAFPGLNGRKYNLDVDVTQNRPVVVTNGHTAATVAALRARYGDVRVDATGTGGPHSCTNMDCRHWLRSGLATGNSPSPSYYQCTLAFTVATGAADLESLTAGHCDTDVGAHAGEFFGSRGSRIDSGSADAEIVHVGGGFKAGPWIFVSNSEPTRHVTGEQSYSDLAVGQWICKSGATTGETCGQVLSRDYSADGLTNLMLTDMCDDYGDSGAGIYAAGGGMAVGIIHGGAPGGCPSGYRGWHTAIQNAEGWLDFFVATSYSTGFMSSISAPESLSTSSTINVTFSKPVSCWSVSPGDFTVRIQNEYNPTVTGASCSNDSNTHVALTVSFPMIKATTVSVSIPYGAMQDPGGQSVGAWTRSTTVP